MIRHLVTTTGLALGLAFAAAPVAPVAAAECGLAALLSSCVATPPSPQPAPLPVPPVVEAVPPAPALPAAPQPVVATAPPAPAPVADTRTAVPAAADRLLQLVNEARAGAGLPALAANARAASIAAGHSTAMAERGEIFHNPTYLTPATRSALGARALGENVAMNGSVEAAHQRLLASPGHRANILDAAFDGVGIAVVRDARGTLFITQDFLDSAGSAPAAAPRPAARPAAATSAATPRPAAVRPAARAAAAAAPAVAAAPVAAPAPDAVLSAGEPAGDTSAAASTDSPARPGPSAPLGAAALAMLVTVVGAGVRFVTSD